MKKSSYRKFLESKIILANRHGFDVNVEDIHSECFPHQKDAIRWAAGLGRALIAMSFGLGKTRIQCELARLIHNRTGEKFLVICPLGVKHQFVFEDGPILGVSWNYCRTDEEIEQSPSPYIITNYERVRDGDITPAKHHFAGVSLDEGSVLRSLGSKTYQVFILTIGDSFGCCWMRRALKEAYPTRYGWMRSLCNVERRRKRIFSVRRRLL